jgi:uncharacterized protein YdeI (YjbR/CyaY-like superfamily)
MRFSLLRRKETFGYAHYVVKPVFFTTPADFRNWLHASHATEVELLLGFYKKSTKKAPGKVSVTYSEALDEALCYGWIDGVRKNIAENAYTIRFTPRKPKSQWSAINIRHVDRLTEAGRMHASGLRAFEGAKDQPRKYSYEQRNAARFPADFARSFRANKPAWQYFQQRPPWYRRVSTFWVVSAKKQETRERRFATLLDDCARGRLLKGLIRPTPKPKSVPKRKKERK